MAVQERLLSLVGVADVDAFPECDSRMQNMYNFITCFCQPLVT